MILRERCDIWEGTQGRYDITTALVAENVPCAMEPVSSTEKEERGVQVSQTYLMVTNDQTIPFSAGAEYYVVWNGGTWNVKGNMADVKIRGRLHHREAIIKYLGTAGPNGP